VWVLSQSHLVCHTWPEKHAVHIDLMTCAPTVKHMDVEAVIAGVRAQAASVRQLENREH